MIEARGLTKQYGRATAVDDLTFDVGPGRVTGFLGPNGAGKTTTMSMIVGLVRPTAGTVTVNGRSYRDLPAPMREVGTLLDARAVHGGRTAYQHLLCLARSNGIPRSRVDDVLGMVGLDDVGGRRVNGFSLGMFQRLGIAAALLGDPEILVFDEPVNGLDPEGVRWIRNLMRDLAADGRTVLVSSHLMSEMAQTADDLLVIGRGELIAQMSVAAFVRANSRSTVLVRTPDAETLTRLLCEAGATVGHAPSGELDGELDVAGMDCEAVGRLAAAAGVVLFGLTTREASLEEAFMNSTHDSVEFRVLEGAVS